MNNDIYVREWMKNCPYMQDSFARKNGAQKLEYGVYPYRVQPLYRENVLGELVPEEIQEAIFVLTAKLQYKDGSTGKYDFYQGVIDWISEQNAKHNFPHLNEGIVRTVNARFSQYVSEPNRAEERNEVQIRFTYKSFNY